MGRSSRPKQEPVLLHATTAGSYRRLRNLRFFRTVYTKPYAPLFLSACALFFIGYLCRRQLQRFATQVLLQEWDLALKLTLAATAAILMLWLVPRWQAKGLRRLTPKERFDTVNEARKTLAQILAALVVVVAFYSASKTFEMSQEQLKIARENSQAQNEATRDGQLTDRYLRAIEQLGASDRDGKPVLERRIGSIYALERIAQESERDDWSVMTVLTTYIREQSPIKPEPPQRYLRNWRPRADVQAALTVLGRRTDKQIEFERRNNLHINLALCDLRGANLNGARLRGAVFVGSLMTSARFAEAELQNTMFQNANLINADFRGAQLQNSELVDVKLQGAHLMNAQLDGAFLSGSDLTDAFLNGVREEPHLPALDEQDLARDQLRLAMCDADTKLPPDLKCGRIITYKHNTAIYNPR
jgi:hypothetical protein